MLLAIEQGNTNTLFAVHDGERWLAQWRSATDSTRTADEYAVWLSQLLTMAGLKLGDLSDCIISSVVPQSIFNLRNLARRYLQVSAAPFHMWTPDVYEGAPTPVVAFFAAAPKLAAMALFARVLAEGFEGATDQWSQVLVAISLISVGVGAFAGLAQKNLKRLWAYSSIANIGYAVMGLASGDAQGVQAMLMFMVLYMVDVTGFFACLAALSRDGRPMESFDDVAGLFRERPGIAIAMTIFSLSALGLPPFSGFWAKYYVFKAAINSGLAVAAAVALVGSVVAAYYYLRLFKVMWFDEAPGRTDKPAGEAQVVALSLALFSFPLVLGALYFLDPLATTAAAALHLP